MRIGLMLRFFALKVHERKKLCKQHSKAAEAMSTFGGKCCVVLEIEIDRPHCPQEAFVYGTPRV